MQGPNAQRAQNMFGNVAVGGDVEGILERSQQELAKISVDQLKQMEQAQRQHVENLANNKTERNIKSFGGILVSLLMMLYIPGLDTFIIF